jgi:hypothetical protein
MQTRVVVGPSLLSSILFALVSVPLWGLGLFVIWKGAWLGLSLIALSALLWLVSLGGVRIVAADNTLEFRRLFWTEWKLPLDHLMVHRGWCSDLPLLPAYLLVDERGEHGTIVELPFDSAALHSLMSLLQSHGAILR